MWIALSYLGFAVVSFLIGLTASASRRRPLPIKGETLRIAQGTSGGDYTSYDITEQPFLLNEAAMANVILTAMLRRPFRTNKLFHDRWREITNDWDGKWIYETRDSRGKAIYFTDTAVCQMFLFFRGFLSAELRKTFELALGHFPLARAMIRLRDHLEDEETLRDGVSEALANWKVWLNESPEER